MRENMPTWPDRHCRVEADEVRLWCEVGGHDWRRPYDPKWDIGRLSYEESCPKHDGMPLSRGEVWGS